MTLRCGDQAEEGGALCNESVDSYNDRLSHSAQDKTYTCPECNGLFSRPTHLRRHLLSHSSKLVFSCTKCKSQFTGEKQFVMHYVAHTKYKTAGDSSISPHRLRTLMPRKRETKSLLTVNSHIDSGENPYACEECDARFSQSSDMEKHVKEGCHGKSLELSSTVSSSRFETDTSKVHDEKNPFSCPHCDSKFSLNFSLQRHMLTHTGEKPFSCTQCDYKCFFESYLKKHMIRHSNERPFSCSHCDRRFSQQRYLRDHEMKSHACQLCGFKFSSKASFLRHYLTHSGKRFSCTQCDYVCAQSGSLKKHQRAHTIQRPFACSQCDAKFTMLSSLEKHFLKHINQKRFSCPKCHYSSFQKGRLEKHLWMHGTGC